jgi:hypothetical protein
MKSLLQAVGLAAAIVAPIAFAHRGNRHPDRHYRRDPE